MRPSLEHSSTLTLNIASSFTAAPLEPALRFWNHEQRLNYDIHLFDDVIFKALGTATSPFVQSGPTANVILFRSCDWYQTTVLLDHTINDFCELLAGFLASTHAPLWLYDVSALDSHKSIDREKCARYSAQVKAALASFAHAFYIQPEDIDNRFPISDVFDKNAEAIASIPFKKQYYQALGSYIMREINAYYCSPIKIIVCDLDNTLWSGICSEEVVKLTAGHRWFQQFLLECKSKGCLLAINSLNDIADVKHVFEVLDMPLSLDDFCTLQINWSSKAANINTIAETLNVGLSSFIFIDDDPVHCATVQAHCDAVRTFCFPSDPEDIKEIVLGNWEFDAIKSSNHVTAITRHQFYKDNEARTACLANNTVMDTEVIADLIGLEAECSEATVGDYGRIGELSLRTNQFNTTHRRRPEAEVQQWAANAGHKLFACRAKDRFGDYGLVGAVFVVEYKTHVFIDSWLLSCRALGKGVEALMFDYFRTQWVEGLGVPIDIAFIDNNRNSAAKRFLLQCLEKTPNFEHLPADDVYRLSPLAHVLLS